MVSCLLLVLCVLSIIQQFESLTNANKAFSPNSHLKPNISEDFSAIIFANLSTSGNINVQNNLTTVRKYSEGKQRSSGCQVWKGRPQKVCTYSLLLEALKVEYGGDWENGRILNCQKSEASGDELVKIWEWVSNASYYKRAGDTMDLWRMTSQDDDSYLESVVGVSVTDPNTPLLLKMTYRSSENSDDYEFWYKNFTTDIKEDAFDVPAICQKSD